MPDEWVETDLSKFPRPSVAVDVAVLTVRDRRLHVVVVEHRHGGLALPGTFLHAGERLTDSAERALREKAGLRGVAFAQLHVFDDPDRDQRGWVLSVGHSAGVADRLLPAGAKLVRVVGRMAEGELLFDHGQIVTMAVDKLQRQYERAVDPLGLMPETFTVLELRRLYEAIFGKPLPKDSFRRHVIGCLVSAGDVAGSAATVGRPAERFRLGRETSLAPGAATFLATGGRQ
jgi:8-oxo-dGTP diphosphatase